MSLESKSFISISALFIVKSEMGFSIYTFGPWRIRALRIEHKRENAFKDLLLLVFFKFFVSISLEREIKFQDYIYFLPFLCVDFQTGGFAHLKRESEEGCIHHHHDAPASECIFIDETETTRSGELEFCTRQNEEGKKFCSPAVQFRIRLALF